MPGAARLNDSIQGTTGGEHTGHVPPSWSPAYLWTNLRGVFRGREYQRAASGYGGKHHHGAGRLLWV